MFFLKSRVPANFPRNEKIEVAATDGSFQTTLSLSDGSVMLEDAHTAVVVIDPMARFGASAFGPLQFRPISSEGVAGDWAPLGTLWCACQVSPPDPHRGICAALTAQTNRVY